MNTSRSKGKSGNQGGWPGKTTMPVLYEAINPRMCWGLAFLKAHRCTLLGRRRISD